jgi:hypothetical protein
MIGTRIALIGCLVAALYWSTAVVAAQVPIMVKNNLFSPERKPPSEETPSTPADTRKTKILEKAFQLDGVFYFGDMKSALLRINSRTVRGNKDKSTSPYVRVQEKDIVGDYQVVRIEPSSITLQGNGETLNIPLFQEGKISPPAAPLPTAPVAEPAGEAGSKAKAEKKPQGKPQAGQAERPAPAVAPVPQPETRQEQPKIRSWRAQGARAMNGSSTSTSNDTNTNNTIDELRRAIDTLQQGAQQGANQ